MQCCQVSTAKCDVAKYFIGNLRIVKSVTVLPGACRELRCCQVFSKEKTKKVTLLRNEMLPKMFCGKSEYC